MFQLSWPKRAKIDKTYCVRRIWKSSCGDYQVVHSHCPYGSELPDVWYAMFYDRQNEMWDIISKHRKRKPAFGACESHAERWAHQFLTD